MSRSPLTHTARSLVTRRLHTPGRQTPNPGQGGSPSLTTISPNSTHPATHQTPPPIPGTSARSSIDIANADPTLHNSLASTSTSSIKQHERKFTPKGKLIPHRPARTIPVNLPSGFPEPPTYPPPPEYFTDLEAKKKDPHPLWQFFHVTPEAKERLKIDAPRPVRAGALDVMGEGEGELSSLSGECKISDRNFLRLRFLERFASPVILWTIECCGNEEVRRIAIMPRQLDEHVRSCLVCNPSHRLCAISACYH